MKTVRKYKTFIELRTYLSVIIVVTITSCQNENLKSSVLTNDHQSSYETKSMKTFLEQNKEKMKTIEQIKISPDPYKPYNLAQGYKVDDMLYISGQAAYGFDGSLIGINNFDMQAAQTFANLKRVLEAGGSSLKNVIKVTIYLKDMGNFKKIVALRKQYFTEPYPADTIIEISSLYSPDALIEIDAIGIADAAVQRK